MGSSSLLWALGLIGVVFGIANFSIGLFGAGFLRFEFKQRNRSTHVRWYRDSQASFALRLGGGVDLYATEHIVFNVGADFIRPYGELRDSELMMYSLGIQYRF